MIESTPLFTTLVMAFGYAYILGMIAHKLNFSPIVGYLLAGVIISPTTPGYSGDLKLAHELSEIGIILLMFSVGLHFSMKDLSKVKAIAIPGAIVQILLATLMGIGVTQYFGWPLAEGLIYGLALSVASTVVLIRTLDEKKLLISKQGTIAVGWLIVEDLAVIIALVVLPPLADFLSAQHEDLLFDKKIWISLSITTLKLIVFVCIMLLFGKRLIRWMLKTTEKTKSAELFRLCILFVALGVAFIAAKLFGASIALGAFFAGVILNGTDFSHRASEEALPFRDAFAVLFFVAMGMLLNPTILFTHFIPVALSVVIIVFGKSIGAYLIVLAFRYPQSTAFMISVSLAQIGEFSFILSALGVKLKMMSQETQDIILCSAIISILLNPLLFNLLLRFKRHTKGTSHAG